MCSTVLVSEHLTKFFLFFKLVFFNYSLRILAHMLTPEGVRPDPDKDNATEAWNAPKRNKSELETFLGIVTYLIS